MGYLVCQMFGFHNRSGSVRINSNVSILGDEYISDDTSAGQIQLVMKGKFCLFLHKNLSRE